MTQVVNLILDKIVEHLTLVMQTEVDVDDLTYADTVKKGLLQEPKLAKNVGLGVSGGDHEDPEYMDGIVTLGDMKNIGFMVEPREVGGGQLWWRRGVIRVECFFVRERLEEEEAFAAGYDILGRVESTLETINMVGVMDDFDERAIKLFCTGNTYFESGGRPRTFIFRGKVFWQCLTERA
jgi:hypothetical protein